MAILGARGARAKGEFSGVIASPRTLTLSSRPRALSNQYGRDCNMRTTMIGLLGIGLLVLGCASDDDATVAKESPSTASTGGSASTAGTTQTTNSAGSASTGGTTQTTSTAGSTSTAGATQATRTDSDDPLGVYEDDFGMSHHVDATAWTNESAVFSFVDFDAKLDQAVARNADQNQFNPGKFSRFDWATDENGQLRYCQTVFDAETQQAAAAIPRANQSSWTQGCSGFAWSILEGPAIIGSYADDWGGTHTIGGQAWIMGGATPAEFELLDLSNTKRYLVAQNAVTNQFSPGKFSRFDWAFDAAGGLYYCQTRFDAETEVEARAATAADSTDLAKGCAGFAWSKLTKSAS